MIRRVSGGIIWSARASAALLSVLALTAACTWAGRERSQTPVVPTASVEVAIAMAPPATLNPFSGESSLATERIAHMALPGAYRINPDSTYGLDLLAEEATVTTEPFTVTYRLRDDVRWSDGEPVTASDLVFTWRTVTDPEFNAWSTTGYDQIRSAEVDGDRTATFTFAAPYSGYRELFLFVLPRHHLKDVDPESMFSRDIAVASGPFSVAAWDGGAQVALVRNPHHPAAGNLRQVDVRFLTDVSSQLQLLRSGEVDVLAPEPEPDLVEGLDGVQGVSWDQQPGVAWEHVGFNVGHPLLQRTRIRQAIALAIDRRAVVDALVDPAGGADEVLDSVFFVRGHPAYEPHFARYGHDPAAARRLLDQAGCAAGDDGVRMCGDDRVSLRYATLSGYAAREATLEIVQAQLRDVGIEIVGDIQEPSVLFDAFETGDWDLAGFGWFGSPDPLAMADVVACGAPLNSYGYCNDDATALLERAGRTLDSDRRFALVNAAETAIAADVPLLPLYQVPAVLAWSGVVAGPAVHPGPEGPLWNVGDWRRTAN